MSWDSEQSVENSVSKIFMGTIESSSSTEPPMAEWSSLISLPPVDSYKMVLYKQGLYDPGSGDICTKYIAQSDSSVLRHVYYAYPGIKDPGIKEALLEQEERKIYSLDGQELYLNLCEEMKVIPVRSFFRGLLKETIDLRYYGVNPKGVRAMSMALNYNQYVRRLDLTSNFLNEDACYHLGQMLRENITLKELVLCGCRIQAEGTRRLVVNLATRSLDLLDLSRNEIGDVGFEYLSSQLTKGALIKRLNLSYNDLTWASAAVFASTLEGNNSITHLDLSWNKMSALKGVNDFLSQLSDSKVLVELNMSWNAMKVSKILKKLLFIPTLRILDLSNNRIIRNGVTAIVSSLQSAKSLHTLDLSNNPLTTQDAFLLVNKLRTNSVKLVNLFMDNVVVNKELAAVLSLSFRRNCTITHGEVYHNYVRSMADMREILLKRIAFLTSKGAKKGHLDIAVYFLGKKKTLDNIQPRQIMADFKIAGTPIAEELVIALCDMFPGPKLDKLGQTMDLAGVTDMIARLWPDRKPPPTPPPLEQKIDKKDLNKDKDKKKKKNNINKTIK